MPAALCVVPPSPPSVFSLTGSPLLAGAAASAAVDLPESPPFGSAAGFFDSFFFCGRL